MTVLEIKEALRSNRPFHVRTSDGKRVPVPHHEFAMLPPDSEVLYVATRQGGLEWIDIAHITAVEFDKAPLPRSRKN